MIMYADVIFIVNLLIDYLLLTSTAYIRKLPIRKWRILMASVCGATYTLFLFFPPLSFAYTLFFKFIFSCMMVWLAFGGTNIWGFIQLLFTFYGLSFFIGGGMFAIHFFLQEPNQVINGVLATHGDSALPVSPPTLLLIVIGFPLMWWLTKKGYRSIEASRQLEVQYVSLSITINEYTFSCTGFVDTGNQLHDPLTRTPVSVMELSLWETILPQEVMKAVQANDVNVLDLSGIEEEWLPRVRLIPYRTVSADTSFLIAIRPDRITVKTEKETYDPQMYIGLRTGTLSSNGSYQAIVHPKALSQQKAS